MAKLLEFVAGELAVGVLQGADSLVKRRQRAVQCEYAHVLNETGQEQFLEERCAGGLSQAAGRKAGEQAASPEQRVVDAIGLGAAQRLDQRKGQRQRQRGVESEDDQCLAQRFAAAALGVHRRIRDPQDLGCQRRIHRDDTGHLADVEVDVTGEFDQPGGDPRR